MLFRVSAGNQAGLGHLARCVALAEALDADDIDSFFLIKSDDPDGLSPFLQNEEVIGPNFKFVPQDCDRSADVELIKSYYKIGFSFLVLDHYEHDFAYQQELKNAGIRWAQFDYQAKERILADIVINGNIAASGNDYIKVTEKHTKQCVGHQFAIVRQEFINQVSSPEKRKILIAMGGGTYPKEVLELIQFLISKKDFDYELVSRDGRLTDVVGNFSNARLHLDSREVVSIYKKSEVAIVSGGVTTYELAALGIPMIIVPFASNQVPNAKAWEKHNFAMSFDNPIAFRKAVDHINFSDLLTELKQKCALKAITIDGLGASRIADTIRNAISI